jgi:hypothetical protein
MISLAVPRADLLGGLQWRALAVGVIALAACIIGAIFSPTQFFRAYLTAYLFFLGIAHGCLAILMVYHLTGGAWGVLIRRILEAGMWTLPLLTLLFVPVACGLPELYLWAQPKTVEDTESLRHKAVYLNASFFWLRAALYFIGWVGLAYCLRTWSLRQDETGDPRMARRLVSLSGPGLVLYGITITFASVDWVMSLQPAFRSTIFGPLFASGELVSGMAFALIVLAWLATRPPLANVYSVEAFNDLGNLLFTFLIVWAYMAFFQFMLVWITNLRYDNIWYLPRSRDGWEWVAWALFVVGFAVPFFLLLVRDVKRNPAALGRVAAVILFMHLVYAYYQVMPAFAGTTIDQHCMDFLTPLAVGGPWLANFLWVFQRSPVVAPHDPNLESAVGFHRHDEEEEARREEMHRA